jgi:hypothetical protein
MLWKLYEITQPNIRKSLPEPILTEVKFLLEMHKSPRPFLNFGKIDQERTKRPAKRKESGDLYSAI